MDRMLSRRVVLASMGAALALPSAARAQGAYPARQVRIVVPFAPGGTTDIVARILAAQLQQRLGQPFVVDNRPGGGATVGSQAAADAPADGYTLLVSNSASHGVSPALYRTVRYDAMADFTHIVLAATTPQALVSNPRWEARSIADVVRIGRATPDGLNVATAGVGSTGHMMALRFGLAAGFKVNPVPYRGSGPALADIIAGNVNFMFDSLASSIGHVRDGQLRALAVIDPQRSSFLPDVPTLAEAGFPGLVSYSWFGISGPKGLPRPIVDLLNREVRAILKLPEVRERFRALTADAPDTTPEQYTDFVREELRVWAEVVRATGATAE
jgi:tripartite-type tricarboxylate transporter receptor subunit TctC